MGVGRYLRMRGAGQHLRAVATAAALLVLAGCTDGPTAPIAGGTSDPELAAFITDDIPRFWAAMDAGGTQGKFDTLYFRPASPGLKEFQRKRGLTPQTMRQAIQTWPTYYASIRATSLSLANNTAVIDAIRDDYRAFAALYGDAYFAPVTFLFGRFSTGGTIGESGILIGTEFYAQAPGSPVDLLTPFQRNNVRPLDSLPIIIAHEMVHIQQLRTGGVITHPNQSLLEQALVEGSADFIGELVSGGNINAGVQAWALPREDSLWTAFQAQMNGTDVSAWLYNQGTATAERPGDLGYFIGYRIAKAYYDERADKRMAIRAILEMRNAQAFLVASTYAP